MSSCCPQLRDQNFSPLTLIDCVQIKAGPTKTRTSLKTQVTQTSRVLAEKLQAQARAAAPAARTFLELALVATALLTLAFMT